MFNLTLGERQALIFLCTVTILGTGAQVLVKRSAVARSVLVIDEAFGKIDINSADQALLEEIPGIGTKLAGRIIAWRDRCGRFASVEELRQIQGLEKSRFEKIKDRVICR